MTSPTDLAALLCSRLCHDLLSPVSALGNGLELLAAEEEPEMRQHCLDLVEQSARTSAAKLKFFRLAFGAAGTLGEEIPAEDARALLAALARPDGKLTLDWAVEPATLSKPAAKVLLNLSAIAMEALVRGGTLVVGAEQTDSGIEIAVHAAGPRIAFDEGIGHALDGTLDESEHSGRTAPALLARLLTEERGGEIQYALTEEALVLGAILPDV